MALKLNFKTNLGSISAVFAAMPMKIDQALYQLVNNAGTRATQDIVNMVSSHLGVSPATVEAALTRRAASELGANYTITARSDRFPMVRWITQRDEKVCPVCGPRDGVLYTTMEIRYIYPAHPNCRCLIEEVSIGEEVRAAAEVILPGAADEIADKVLDVFIRGMKGL